MQDASRPPRIPAPSRAQTRVTGLLKRIGTEQTAATGKKKARRDEVPKSPEITIVPEAKHFVSPMISEYTNIPVEDAPTGVEEPQDIQSSKIQQRRMFIPSPFFVFLAFFY